MFSNSTRSKAFFSAIVSSVVVAFITTWVLLPMLQTSSVWVQFLLLLLAMIVASTAPLLLTGRTSSIERASDEGTPARPRAVNATPSTASSSGQSRSAGEAGALTETGIIKWFNTNKGFGFITRDSGEDVFVHFRSVQGRNRNLKPGQMVEYRVVQGDRGPQAEDVVPLN